MGFPWASFLLKFAFSGLLQSEVSVACRWSFRLFDRRSPLALPTLITQSATVSNFLPQAHKKGKEKYIVFDPPKMIFSFLKPDITHDFVETIQTTYYLVFWIQHFLKVRQIVTNLSKYQKR